MIRFFALLLFSSLLFTSCHLGGDRIRGNGTIKTESRNAGVFSIVDVSGNIEVHVKQDSAFSVRVEADENLMEYIVIRTDGGRLVIQPKEHSNLSGSKAIKVYVSAPVFKKLEASGASDIVSDNLLSSESIDIDVTGASSVKLEIKSPRVSADVTGASSVFLTGQTKDLSLDGQGASHLRCYQLLSENADVDVSGASSSEVFASVNLKADASGASNIKYKGAAKHTGSASGAGSITRLE